MNKLTVCRNVEEFEPITRPYTYVCHVVDKHRLAVCSFHTGECIWCRNKEPIRRWLALFSDIFFSQFYLDFGSQLYIGIKDKIRSGYLSESKTTDMFLQSYTDKLMKREVTNIYVEESCTILEDKIDDYVWKL